MGGEDGPSRGAHPVLLGDGFGVAAIADAGLAAEEVGYLDGGHERGVFTGFLGLMVPADGFDEDWWKAMLLEVDGAEFGMVDTDELFFEREQVFGGVLLHFLELLEFLRESGGHGDLADVMDKSGDVVGFIIEGVEGADDFAGKDGGADAVLPEAAPVEGGISGEFLEVFDDGGDHGELAYLADAEVEDGFLDPVDGGSEAVVDGVDQAQEAGGEAGVTPDDFGDL